MGKSCNLCGENATLHCSADDAELCWSCDAKVHGANYLVARHLRLVLCSFCSAETECQTSGPSPFPLSRRCSTCDPAHVDEHEQANMKGSVLKQRECNNDNEESSPFAVPRPAMDAEMEYSCASQESLNDAHSSVEDEKASSKSFAERSRERTKRMRGGGGSGAAAFSTNRSLAHGHSRKPLSVRTLRKKRSGSPVSVIPVDKLRLNERVNWRPWQGF